MTLFDCATPRLFALPPGVDFATAFARGLRLLRASRGTESARGFFFMLEHLPCKSRWPP